MASELLTKEEIELSPVRASVDTDLYIGCGLCEVMCDYGAVEGTRL